MARPTSSPARVPMSPSPMVIRPWLAAPAMIIPARTIIHRAAAVTALATSAPMRTGALRWVGGSSTVTGGAGDDYIKVTGDNSTINFAKGDGNDVVRVDNGSGSVDFSISGYSLNNVIVTQQYGRTTVNFKGSNDSLVFDHGSNGSARLSFADH